LYHTTQKKLSLIGDESSLTEKLKVLEIRQKIPKATGAVIIKLFYEETERSITDSTLRRIIKNEENIIASKER
jgi:hypothetical protein